jgi:predicted deacylase
VAWDDYARTYVEYVERLRSLGWPAREIGRSVEGRPIYAVFAGRGPLIAITAGQHGNEHPGPELLLHFLRDLRGCRFSAGTPALCRVSYAVVPVVNPDGFDGWRRVNANCVDPNRNWPEGWGGPGSEPGSCCATCRGNAPLDQPETRAVYSLLGSLRVAFHIDLHSGTEVLAWPYACRSLGRSPFWPVYESVARRHEEIARERGVEPYPYGWIPADIPPELRLVIYEACGAINDTVDRRLGVPSMVLEMSHPYNPPYSELVSSYYPRLQAVLSAIAERALGAGAVVTVTGALPAAVALVAAMTAAAWPRRQAWPA